jgi:putative endonuclease
VLSAVRIPPSPPDCAKASDGRPFNEVMWYVYILRSSADSQLYVGSTNDLQRWLREHQDGRCDSTRHRRPLELEAYVAVREESTARSLEKYLKSGSGIATLRKRILTSEVPTTYKVPAIRSLGVGWYLLRPLRPARRSQAGLGFQISGVYCRRRILSRIQGSPSCRNRIGQNWRAL